MPLRTEAEKSTPESMDDDSRTDPCLALQEDDLKHRVDRWIDELTVKHREVLPRRFRLRAHLVGTLEGVGLEIGVTWEAVRLVQVEGLARLRELIESQRLHAANVLS